MNKNENDDCNHKLH